MPITLVLPLFVRRIAQNLKGDDVSYKVLVNFLLFFILDAKSYYALARLFPHSYSVSNLSRSAQVFPFNRFRRRLLTSVLKFYDGKIDPDHLGALRVSEYEFPMIIVA